MIFRFIFFRHLDSSDVLFLFLFSQFWYLLAHRLYVHYSCLQYFFFFFFQIYLKSNRSVWPHYDSILIRNFFTSILLTRPSFWFHYTLNNTNNKFFFFFYVCCILSHCSKTHSFISLTLTTPSSFANLRLFIRCPRSFL